MSVGKSAGRGTLTCIAELEKKPKLRLHGFITTADFGFCFQKSRPENGFVERFTRQNIQRKYFLFLRDESHVAGSRIYAAQVVSK